MIDLPANFTGFTTPADLRWRIDEHRTESVEGTGEETELASFILAAAVRIEEYCHRIFPLRTGIAITVPFSRPTQRDGASIQCFRAGAAPIANVTSVVRTDRYGVDWTIPAATNLGPTETYGYLRNPVTDEKGVLRLVGGWNNQTFGWLEPSSSSADTWTVTGDFGYDLTDKSNPLYIVLKEANELWATALWRKRNPDQEHLELGAMAMTIREVQVPTPVVQLLHRWRRLVA